MRMSDMLDMLGMLDMVDMQQGQDMPNRAQHAGTAVKGRDQYSDYNPSVSRQHEGNRNPPLNRSSISNIHHLRTPEHLVQART
jgi:hypothetical protein